VCGTRADRTHLRGERQLGYFFFFVGSFLRFVFAKSRSCFSLIDFAICLEAPLSEDFERSPRFAPRRPRQPFAVSLIWQAYLRLRPSAFRGCRTIALHETVETPECEVLTEEKSIAHDLRETPRSIQCRTLKFQPVQLRSMARSPFPEGASILVLFVHGSGSSRHSPRNKFVAETLNRAGLATLLFDLLAREEEAVRIIEAGLATSIHVEQVY
jgi:hypothetical protein